MPFPRFLRATSLLLSTLSTLLTLLLFFSFSTPALAGPIVGPTSASATSTFTPRLPLPILPGTILGNKPTKITIPAEVWASIQRDRSIKVVTFDDAIRKWAADTAAEAVDMDDSISVAAAAPAPAVAALFIAAAAAHAPSGVAANVASYLPTPISLIIEMPEAACSDRHSGAGNAVAVSSLEQEQQQKYQDQDQQQEHQQEQKQKRTPATKTIIALSSPNPSNPCNSNSTADPPTTANIRVSLPPVNGTLDANTTFGYGGGNFSLDLLIENIGNANARVTTTYHGSAANGSDSSGNGNKTTTTTITEHVKLLDMLTDVFGNRTAEEVKEMLDARKGKQEEEGEHGEKEDNRGNIYEMSNNAGSIMIGDSNAESVDVDGNGTNTGDESKPMDMAGLAKVLGEVVEKLGLAGKSGNASSDMGEDGSVINKNVTFNVGGEEVGSTDVMKRSVVQPRKMKKGSAGHIACCIFTVGICPGGPHCQLDMGKHKRSVEKEKEKENVVFEPPAMVEKRPKKGSPKHIVCCIFSFGICPRGPKCNLDPENPKTEPKIEPKVEKEPVKAAPKQSLEKRMEKGSPRHIACCFFTLGFCPGGPNCRFPKPTKGIRPNAEDVEKLKQEQEEGRKRKEADEAKKAEEEEEEEKAAEEAKKAAEGATKKVQEAATKEAEEKVEEMAEGAAAKKAAEEAKEAEEELQKAKE